MSSDPLAIINAACLAAGKSDSCFDPDDLPEDFGDLEETPWGQYCKYQLTSWFIKHQPTGRYFKVNQSRSGSHHTDWYYNEPVAFEVRKIEKVVTTTVWEKV